MRPRTEKGFIAMTTTTRRLFLSAIALVAMSAHAAGTESLQSLENFFRSAKSGRAAFTQTVTSPAKAGQAAKTKISSGSFEFQRPNRFRFEYKKPFEQTIVADGTTLWLYDADLKQVTARKQAQTLGSTPAALIASAPDLKALQADFALQAAPDKDGLQWVVATPKAKDGQLQSVRVGFKPGGNELSALEILDSFGQTSSIRFSQFELNPAINASTFAFKPPAGADVIRQ